MSTRALGAAGEAFATEFLQSKGYNILQRNFRTPRGEVDIICETLGTVVFVEVKRWSHLRVESLEQAIDRQKQGRIANAARHFLWQNGKYREFRVRFDVVFVDGKERRVRHIEGAFESPWPG